MLETAGKRNLDSWVAFLGQAAIPVLASTGRELEELRGNEMSLNARNVSRIILKDPLMTVKLLNYLQTRRSATQSTEVIQVEEALLLLGLDTFYHNVPSQPTIESMLDGEEEARHHCLGVIERAHRAANYAIEWAIMLHDMHFNEIYTATLLHDLAEILMWCFSPTDMLQIRHAQDKDSTLRSRDAQIRFLGFSLRDLQLRQAQQWSLPRLLLALMEEGRSHQVRVRNVVLAVNLARHSSEGWDNAALPDDFTDISELLHLPVPQIRQMLLP